MNIEDQISELNEFYFFREFTYSENKFIKNDGQEVEIADNIVFLDNIFIIYQIKTRKLIEKATPEKENKWFESKVLKKATKQIRDTVRYLSDYDEIVLKNGREDSFNVATSGIKSAQKVIVYKDTGLLPTDKKQIKFYESQTVGIIHIFSMESYKNIIQTLITPAEVFEFLEFREKMISKYPKEMNSISENSILGQYIIADLESPPNQTYSILTLKEDYEKWDILNIIHLFPQRVTYSASKTDYYYILREIGKLMRHELKIFKERFILSMESSKENRADLPYRFAMPTSDLGFVFIPLRQDQKIHRKQGLSNLTLGHKYDQKLTKCIGASFFYEKDGWYAIEWCFIEFDWEYDLEMEEMLKNNFPFRKVNPKIINRYETKEPDC